MAPTVPRTHGKVMEAGVGSAQTTNKKRAAKKPAEAAAPPKAVPEDPPKKAAAPKAVEEASKKESEVTKKKKKAKAAPKTAPVAAASDPEGGEESSDEEPDVEGDAVAGGAPRKTKANRFDALQADAGAAPEEPAEPRGVIYLGHIPKGFFEPQLRTFFTQFGKVTRLRLSRSKKNAASKGYAFVEFEEEGVAKIVADTMNKYLLFGKQLVCHLVAKDKQHPALFKGCRKRMVNQSNSRRRKQSDYLNIRPTVEVDGDMVPQTTVRQDGKRLGREKKLKSLLGKLDIDFSLDDICTGEEVVAHAARSPRSKPQDAAAPAPAPDSSARGGKKKRKQAEAEAISPAAVAVKEDAKTSTLERVSKKKRKA